MQTWRLPLILFCLAVAGAAYLFFFDTKKQGTAEQIFFEKRLFPRFDPNQAHRVTVRRSKTDDLRFELEQGTWKIVAPMRYDADPFDIEDLLWILADLEYLQKIQVPRDSSRLSAYGLDSPRFVLRANWGPRDEIELRVGDDSPRPGTVYVQIRKNDPWVYSVTRDVADILAKPAEQWRTRRLLDSRGMRVTGVRYESAGTTTELTSKNNHWTLDEQPAPALDQDAVNKWLTDIFTARVDRYCNDEELQAIRRNTPGQGVTWEFFGEDGAVISGLRFVTVKRDDGQSFAAARRQGESAWVLLNNEQTQMLSATPHDFINTKPLNHPTSAVTQITVNSRDETFTLERSDGGWLLRPENKTADNASVDRFLALLSRPVPKNSLSRNVPSDTESLTLAEFAISTSTDEDNEQNTELFRVIKDVSGSLWGVIPGLPTPCRLDEDYVRPLLVTVEDFLPRSWTLPEEFITDGRHHISAGTDTADLSAISTSSLFALLRTVNVETWLRIEPTCSQTEQTFTLSSESNFRLIICICGEIVCRIQYESPSQLTAFRPDSAWGRLLLAKITQAISAPEPLQTKSRNNN